MNQEISVTKYLPFSWAAVGMSLLLICAADVAPVEAQQTFSPQQGQRITLRNQLTSGLRARTAADKAFIEKVIDLVQAGTLPRNLVDSTFLWARKYAAKKSNSRRLRPIVYFEPILIARAQRLGIKI